jgi:hypothetical protein
MKTKKPQSLEEEFVSKLGAKLDACGIKVIQEVEPYFDLLKARFPIETSRIGWDLVPNATESTVLTVSSFYGISREMACKNFLSEQIQIHELSGHAYLVNDGLDAVLAGNVRSFEQIFESLLWPHGHIYLLAESGDWCLNVTFEDDLYFGYAPPRTASLQ